MKKAKHGGPRPNSGRPKKEGDLLITTAVRLPPDMAEYAREQGVSQLIRSLIERSRGFREWKKSLEKK